MPFTQTVRQAARAIFGDDNSANIRATLRLITSGKLQAQKLPGGENAPYLVSQSSINAYKKKRAASLK
jgi:hypothetical protein